MTTNINAQELQTFIAAVLATKGVNQAQCQSVAVNMVWSEMVGRSNFGINRIPVLTKRVDEGVLNPDCKPQFQELSPSTGKLDADNGFGQYAGEVAMDRAIGLARQNGVGVVSVNNSNFFGTGAYFVQQAAAQKMIGLAMSNSFPKVAPHGGSKAVFGTNPFAFGAPRQNGHSLLVDFATSSLAGSTVREYLEKGIQLPEGMAVMKDGEPVRDPAKIGDASLLPFGGPKGFGLSLMVELLAGVLSGAGVSHGVKSIYSNFTEASNAGHLFVALDITRWMQPVEFFQRFESLIDVIKSTGPEGQVLLPGEIRWANYEASALNGIPFSKERISEIEGLSQQFSVKWPSPA